MESNYGFCEAGSLANEIYSLLASNLLGEDQYEKIVTRYGDMRINFNNYPRDFVKPGRSEWSFSEGLEPFKPGKWDRYYWDTTAVPIPITHPDFVDLVSRTERRGAIGLDFPTWFSSSGNKLYIMLVAQDPLRNADWYGDKKDSCYLCTDAVVSTPFGLHDAHHREHGNGGKRVWLLVQSLLKKYNVYLTDCRKYFVYNHKESSKYTTQVKMALYEDILNKEIELTNPVLIVTLGHEATDFCKKILGDDKRLSGYMPHLSGRAGCTINRFFEKNSTDIASQAELYSEYIDRLINGFA